MASLYLGRTTKKAVDSSVFFSGIHKKHHYRYPIVVFSKNAAIGISIATFRGSIVMFLNFESIVAFQRAYSSVLKTPL